MIKGAILVSMDKGSPPRPSCILASKEEELISAQKSKYSPIPLLTFFKECKNLNYPLAIVGLPCHFHGLYNISKIFPEVSKNIKYKIGLICGGVMLYSSMDYLIRKSGERFSGKWEIIYRDKSAGGYPGNIRISDNNRTVILKKRYRISIKDYFIPPSCRICFDKMNIFSDITVGDPWGIKGFDYKNGSSVCVARNQIGNEVIENGIKKKYLNLQEIAYNRIIEGQQIQLKKKELNEYLNAWLTLKGEVPNYSNLFRFENNSSENSSYLEKLKFSFYINQLSSLELAFNEIDKKIHKKEKFRILKNLLKPKE